MSVGMRTPPSPSSPPPPPPPLSPSTADIGLGDFLSSLDPLAANAKAHLESSLKGGNRRKEGRMAAAVDEEGREMDEDLESWLYDDSDDSDHSHSRHRNRDAHHVSSKEEAEEAEAVSNTFIAARRLRMRAEKLIDHSFLNRLFLRHTPLMEGQALIRRLESLFELLDADKTGYVSFEAFTRLVLAVAPPRILRADVLAFVAAQTKNLSDMVDYNEFVISGKVLLLTKGQFTQKRVALASDGGKKGLHITRDNSINMPTSTLSWLKRQKAVSGSQAGDSSTLTWKQHLRWYQRRKARAVIWLIRRATRSLTHEVTLLDAQRWLLVRGKQACAMDALIALGHAALLTQAKGMVAKSRLCKRVMHARRFVLKVQAAREYLKGIALTALAESAKMDRVAGLKTATDNYNLSPEQATKTKDHFFSKKKKIQANYGNLFKVTALQKLAFLELRSRAVKALTHSKAQELAVEYLQAYSRKIVGQMMSGDRARRRLRQRAEAAYRFCLLQDQSLLGLLRTGHAALAHFDRQTASLAWLVSRGREAIDFLSDRTSTISSLIALGGKTLLFLNNREDAFVKLNNRRMKAVAFVIRKQEAISYLRNKPRNIWKILDNTQIAQNWLFDRAQKAKKHYLRKLKSFQFLCFLAGSATATGRKTHLAFNDLCQLGTAAKYSTFKLHLVPKSVKLQKLIAAEKARNWKIDQTHRRIREKDGSWSFEERLKVELLEAFVCLTSVYSPSHVVSKKPLKRLEALSSKKVRSRRDEEPPPEEEQEEPVLMGQLAYRILTNNGKLLQVPLAAIDEQFRNTDIDRSCYLPFSALYPWLRRRCLKLKHQSPSFEFRCSDLLSAEERATMSIYLRVQRDGEFLATADELSEYEEARKRLVARNKRLNDDSDEDEEQEEEAAEEGDEDLLFADLERLRNMDVGRLMRYLTRRREEKEYAKMMAAAGIAVSPTDGAATAATVEQQAILSQATKEKKLDEQKVEVQQEGKELDAEEEEEEVDQTAIKTAAAEDAPPPIAI